MDGKMTKWSGWVSIHRGKDGPNGERLAGEQIAGSAAYEFELAGGPGNVDLARTQLLELWEAAGKPVSAQWSEADRAVQCLNVRAI